MELFIQNLNQSLIITLFVFIMMIITDYINVLTKGKFNKLMKGRRFRQYAVSTFLGATPGDLGGFMSVSFYLRGIISLGALAGAMAASSGDESFVMLALFPKTALLLFALLFILGNMVAYLTDKIVFWLKIETCPECRFADNVHNDESCRSLSFKEMVLQLGNISFTRFLLILSFLGMLYFFLAGFITLDEGTWLKVTFISLILISIGIIFTATDHYLEEHIWHHIFKQHLWKIFLWTFGVLIIMAIGLKYFDLHLIIKSNLFIVLIFAAVIGIIPESGPHLIFVTMYAKGLIPLSILITSSIVQSGHGMLPLLSYSVKDFLRIKAINIVVGLLIGGLLFYFGL